MIYGVHDALRLSGVRKKVGDFELRADFEVLPGARLAITGPSGSGKSTLLRIIAGLEPLTPPDDRGRILLGDRDLTRVPPQGRGVGMVFQDPALFPSMKLWENAAFGLRMRGLGARERYRAVMPWLERVGLSAHEDRGVEKLSGGEKQRVAFVRALCWKPQVVLLDEPFSALDQELRHSLRQSILDLHQEWPAPLILVTHDVEDVAVLASARKRIVEQSPGIRWITE